jgi:hypothetical protein
MTKLTIVLRYGTISTLLRQMVLKLTKLYLEEINNTRFRHNYPIPAYLIAFAVTNYTVINQTAGTFSLIVKLYLPRKQHIYSSKSAFTTVGAGLKNYLKHHSMKNMDMHNWLGWRNAYNSFVYGHSRVNCAWLTHQWF